jgi:hypothetical protein
MSNSFTNLSILECNRLSSEEGKNRNDENPALFTNKLGTGVMLNEGDTIQVSSAFISEQGAGDENTIEFKGANLNATKEISYITPTFTEPVNLSVSKEGYAKIIFNASTPPITLKDNEASIVINYYKSANGENYYQLPRKYTAYMGPGSHGGSVSASGTHNLWYAQEDSLASGNASFSKGGLPFHQVPYFTRQSSKGYYVDADYKYFSGAVYDSLANNQATGDFYKLRNNGERYTIYVAKESYYVSQLDSSGDPTGVTNYAPASYWVYELSQREYLRYSERIDLSINQGFNSALNVANTLSNQLTETGEVQDREYPSELQEPYFSPSKKFTTFLESPTYKTFVSSNASASNSDVYLEYNVAHDNSDSTQTPNQDTIDYINQTNYIGIKRPDLYDAGYQVANGLLDNSGSAFTIAPKITAKTITNSNLLQTDIPFTTHNLDLLKTLMDEEGKHPELFTNKYNEYYSAFSGSGTTTDNSRFLHLNSRRWIYSTSGSQVDLDRLGTDDVSNASSSFNSAIDNYISLPIFFYFDKTRSETAEGGDLNDPDKLYYGFAMKNSTGFICFWVGGSHGTQYAPIPPDYFLYNNNSSSGTTDNIAVGTHIGWDTHFTAYSTCAIALTDGWIQELWGGQDKVKSYWNVGLNTTWDTTTAITPNASTSREVSPVDQTPYLSRIYLGAQSPLISYNASSNRFSISQLHTAEYSGNLTTAGGTNASFSVPLNPDANQKVYKINKRSNANSWTTACIPFTAIDSISASGTDNFDLELPNINLDNWVIFDSNSGIVIKDFGFTEETWDDGLWGIMGFTYNQFNTERSANNDITERLTERNFQAIPYAFTNADVSASDTIDFNVNGWGSPMYNAMLPTTFIWNGSGQTASTNVIGSRQGFLVENPPPITKEQRSIELTAVNLPRRMIRPYYCIRSDILADSYYLGGADSGQALPVVAVVNKIDGYGDFYFSNQSDLIFTNTKSRMLTSITTSIHSPDQSFARVNGDSAVIYKITKQQPAVTNVVAELLQEMNKKEQLNFLSKIE